MRRILLLLATVPVLASCFTTTADFKNDAEDFIESNEELSNALGVTFPSATCDEPTSQDVGERFLCDAVDSENRSWEFEIEITGSNEYEVNVSRFP